MTDTMPVYVPSTVPPLAAMVHLPPGDVELKRPLILLPSGRNPRIHDLTMVGSAPVAAAGGVPVLRVDYPGCGLSPGKRIDDEPLIDELKKVAEWFADSCGSSRLAVGGMCRGARLAVTLAARCDLVEQIVGVTYPFGPNTSRSTRRLVKEGLAAIEPLGSRTLSLLTRRTAEATLNPALPAFSDLEEVAKKSKITLIYGDGDFAYEQFQLALASDFISQATRASLSVVVRKDAHLYQHQTREERRWVVQAVAAALTDGTADA